MNTNSEQANAVQESQGVNIPLQIRCSFCNSLIDTRFGFCTLCFRLKEKMITSQEKTKTEVTQISPESTAASVAKTTIDNEEKQTMAVELTAEEIYPPDTFTFKAADCIEYALDKMGDGIIYIIGKICEFFAWTLRVTHIR